MVFGKRHKFKRTLSGKVCAKSKMDLLLPTNEVMGCNVFTCVCLSVHRGGLHVTITHDALGLTVQDPPALFCATRWAQTTYLFRDPYFPCSGVSSALRITHRRASSWIWSVPKGTDENMIWGCWFIFFSLI